jgi:hypothetical protein
VTQMVDEDIADTDDAVADAPADSPPPADTTDELDALLKEFTEGTQGNNQPADQSTNQNVRDQAFAENLNAITEGYAIDARRDELRAAEQRLLLEQHQRDLGDAVQEVRSGLDKNLFSDGFIQTWLDSKANSDPRLQELWLQRAENPRAMKSALNKLAAEFHETYGKVSKVDEEATVDHAAVAQAVRLSGAKIPPSPPPNLGRMSNAEFRQHVRDSYGFEPS